MRRPNVLFLMSDQHSRRIAGFAGNPIARTPNLDRLASESVRFENAYCQFPLCTPSRIGMRTGRLPRLCGACGNNSPIDPEYLTIPEHFERHGYVTCGIGKMHVGGLVTPENSGSAPVLWVERNLVRGCLVEELFPPQKVIDSLGVLL